jgi:tRNA-2-methylthio-N6-dimethylallyladenosine synthase
MVGRVVSVLFEKPGRMSGQMVGKSEYLHAVHASAAADLAGQVARVRIVESVTNSLAGEVVE